LVGEVEDEGGLSKCTGKEVTVGSISAAGAGLSLLVWCPVRIAIVMSFERHHRSFLGEITAVSAESLRIRDKKTLRGEG